ncbi:MAG: DUF2914 domain-containing protein [Longimicrobiales bacterium]|nr:DUF2914 domain-containing protein [Longimicrobiales bacterium]
MRRFTAAVLPTVVVLLTPAASTAQEPTVEAVVATDVENREPVGEGTVFPVDVGRLFVWTRVTDATGTSIQHVWMHPDGQETPVSLDIGGSPWRTWSSKTIPPEWSGEWTVEIRDAAGNVLETVAFTVGG